VLLVLTVVNICYFGSLAVALIGEAGPSDDPVIGRYLLDQQAIGSAAVLLEEFSLCFCVSALLAVRSAGGSLGRRGSPRVAWGTGFLLARFGAAVVVVYAVVVLATIWFKPPVMGAAAVQLPYRLGGVLFFGKVLLIPYLCLCGVELARSGGKRGMLLAFLVLLFLNAVTDSILRASRGPVAWATVMYLFVYVSEGRLPPRRVVLFAVGGIMLAAFLFPYITRYRWLRAIEGYDAVEALTRVRVERRAADSSGNLGGGIIEVFGRLDMGSMLVVVLGSNPEPLYGAALPIIIQSNIASYLTVTVFGRSDSARASIGPTFVGWLWLVGGRPLVLCVGAFLGAACVWGWAAIRRRRLHLTVAPCSLFLYCLLALLSDGALEGALVMLTVSICIAFVCEILVPMLAGSNCSSCATADRRLLARST
jgi:hypothetical protein